MSIVAKTMRKHVKSHERADLGNPSKCYRIARITLQCITIMAMIFSKTTSVKVLSFLSSSCVERNDNFIYLLEQEGSGMVHFDSGEENAKTRESKQRAASCYNMPEFDFLVATL